MREMGADDGLRADGKPTPAMSEPGTDIWTPEDVRLRLEEAGRTLMSLPLPKGAFPRDDRSNWPDVVRGYEDAFAALIGASDGVKGDFADGHNRVRLAPGAAAVGRMDEALDWLWRIDDVRKRRLCLCRALIHPVSGRHIVSYRKLGRMFGLHHETMRAWHDRALAQIAIGLTEGGTVKTANRKRGRRRPLPNM